MTLDAKTTAMTSGFSQSKVFYRQHGNREAVPCIYFHGFLGSSSDWDFALEEIPAGSHHLTLDIPGSGKSILRDIEKPLTFDSVSDDVESLLNELKIKEAIFCGYSLGGRVALFSALKYPGRVKAIILESSSPGIEKESEKLERRLKDEALSRRLEDNFKDFLKGWYEAPLFASLQKDRVLLQRTIEKRLSENRPEWAAKTLKELSPGVMPDLWPALGGLKCPALLVCGELDHKYRDIMSRMKGLLSEATLIQAAGAGHNVHLETPLEFLKAIRTFIEKHSP